MTGSALSSGSCTTLDATEEATTRTLIQALIHRYASIAREDRDEEEVAKCFEVDAFIRFPDGREVKPTMLADIIKANRPKLLRHHITTVDIQFQSSDQACFQCFFMVVTDVKTLDHWGRWDGVVKRQNDGRWRFKEIFVAELEADPEGWFAGLSG